MMELRKDTIFIAVGANLPDAEGRMPRAACQAAVVRLGEMGFDVIGVSRWYESPPLPDNGGPWYVNGVVHAETALEPVEALERLHAIEAAFGRVRRQRWESRPLDLDIIDHGGMVRRPRIAAVPIVPGAPVQTTGGAPDPELPHPRMHERAFVLLPLADVAPGWRHPMLDRSVEELIAALPAGQIIRPCMEEAPDSGGEALTSA
ncbi:2-amino-4-hydroxy-6-hydroxymethyldihydropteridine diphosphokinase [Tistrella mobilis]|uniref:2-amino-4-hydroxy-6- hydroxymethyldihydropteridine diphosphokinase n=1 Tax=Tistrella mobilis TaxID=171437 RepID=UPI003555F5CC